MLENSSVAKYLYCVLTEEQMESKKAAFLKECGKNKIVLLWKIFFETDIHDTELLKERIYGYGSLLKEKDYFGRELFLCLVAVLNLVIK